MKNRRKNREAFADHSYWQSYSDMMAALLLIFILIIAITLSIYRQKTTDLDNTRIELDKAQSQLNQTITDLENSKAELEKSNQELASSLTELQQAYAQANEVVSMASQQAQEILDNATIEANNVRAAAMQYMDDMLAHLENIITSATQSARSGYENFTLSMNQYRDIIQSNRNELHPAEDYGDVEFRNIEDADE